MNSRFLKALLLIVLCFTSKCFSGVFKLEWNHPNTARKIVLAQYLANRPEDINRSGPITIYAEQFHGLGYVAYANTLVSVILDSFPDARLRVIVKSWDEEKQKIIDAFNFDDRVEFRIVGYTEDKSLKIIQPLFNEASLVFSISNDSLNYDVPFYVKINQLDPPDHNKEQEKETELKRLTYQVFRFRSYADFLPDLDRDLLASYLFNSRSCPLVIGGNPSLEDKNIPPFKVANDIYQSNETLCKEASFELIGKYLKLKSKLNVSVVEMGFSSEKTGVLIDPKLNSNSRLNVDIKAYNSLKLSSPELMTLLANEGADSSGRPRFYMSYLKSFAHLERYLSIIRYLEQDQEPVVLTNLNLSELHKSSSRWGVGEVFLHGLSRHDIGRVKYTDLLTGRTEIFETGSEVPYTIHVVKLPAISDPDAYSWLFAKSQQPVGVRGNQSLFNAIALEKLALYGATTRQLEVNDLLAGFDASHKLAPFFREDTDPKEIASIILDYGHLIKWWSKRIIFEKNINGLICSLVRITLSEEAEIEEIIKKVNEGYDSKQFSENSDMVSDLIQIKILSEYIKGIGQSPSPISSHYQLIREEANSTANKINDVELRNWLNKMRLPEAAPNVWLK